MLLFVPNKWTRTELFGKRRSSKAASKGCNSYAEFWISLKFRTQFIFQSIIIIFGLSWSNDLDPVAVQRVGTVGRISAILPMARTGIVWNVWRGPRTLLVRSLIGRLVLILVSVGLIRVGCVLAATSGTTAISTASTIETASTSTTAPTLDGSDSWLTFCWSRGLKRLSWRCCDHSRRRRIVTSVNQPLIVSFFKQVLISILIELFTSEFGFDGGAQLGHPEPIDHFGAMAVVEGLGTGTDLMD